MLYTQSDGTRCEARVLAAHPGAPDDPEPCYTVELVDGSERDTVRSRLEKLSALMVPDAAACRGMRLLSEEVFGPLITVIRFETDDELVGLCEPH